MAFKNTQTTHIVDLEDPMEFPAYRRDTFPTDALEAYLMLSMF